MKLLVWMQGDRTVGDGTLTATVEIDNMVTDPEMTLLVKEALADAFAKIWDGRPSMVHVDSQSTCPGCREPQPVDQLVPDKLCDLCSEEARGVKSR